MNANEQNRHDLNRQIIPDKPNVEGELVIEICYRRLANSLNVAQKDYDKRRNLLETTTLRPAKVGAPYDARVELFESDVDPKSIQLFNCDSKGFDAYGLKVTFDEKYALRLQGAPTRQHDGRIKIILTACYKIKEPASFFDVLVRRMKRSMNSYEPSVHTLSVPFLVNPDPWTLWEEHEPPTDAPYPKAHVDHQSGRAPNLEGKAELPLLVASRRGRSHAHIGAFRDDDFAVRLAQTPDEWSCFAISDGAGSAKFSREGARIACATAVATMNRTLNSPLAADVDAKIHAELEQRRATGNRSTSYDPIELEVAPLLYSLPSDVYHAILAEMQRRQKIDETTKLRDYSATLLCAAIRRLERGPDESPVWVVVSYAVGDGIMVVDGVDGHDEVVPLMKPDSGEYAGQTRFITMADQIEATEVFKRIQLHVFHSFHALVMATDGVTDPFFPTDKSLTEATAWREFWQERLPTEFVGVLDEKLSLDARAKALEDGLNFRVKGNHDDRTILILFGDSNP